MEALVQVSPNTKLRQNQHMQTLGIVQVVDSYEGNYVLVRELF